MICTAKELSPDQKLAIESLLGRPISDYEQISVSILMSSPAPQWLQKSWESAEELGLDRLSMEEIDTEIAAARRARREQSPQSGQ